MSRNAKPSVAISCKAVLLDRRDRYGVGVVGFLASRRTTIIGSPQFQGYRNVIHRMAVFPYLGSVNGNGILRPLRIEFIGLLRLVDHHLCPGLIGRAASICLGIPASEAIAGPAKAKLSNRLDRDCFVVEICKWRCYTAACAYPKVRIIGQDSGSGHTAPLCVQRNIAGDRQFVIRIQ